MNIEQLNKTPHNQICDLARDKFIEVYNQKFGEGGEVFFEEQKALFNNELLNGSFKGYLEKATSLNIHDAFMNLAINGLSLEKGTTTLCYLMGYSNYDKNTRQSTYTAKITYTGYGEILLRQRAGQILRCDNPVVVYDCDDFRFGERDGHKFVDYVKTYPRPANSYIVACYVKIILPNNSYDYFVLDREGIDRLREYSAKFGGQDHRLTLFMAVIMLVMMAERTSRILIQDSLSLRLVSMLLRLILSYLSVLAVCYKLMLTANLNNSNNKKLLVLRKLRHRKMVLRQRLTMILHFNL